MTKQDLGKKVWYDPDVGGYIGLDLINDIPAQTPRTIKSVELLLKSEYHCSLVATRRYINNREKEQSIANAVSSFLQTHPFHYISLGATRYLCRKNNEMTIIAPVEIVGLEELLEYIQSIIPEYRSPFPHVTLLKSKATKWGIAVNSVEELAQHCEKLDQNT
jgi:hypothetical protein